MALYCFSVLRQIGFLGKWVRVYRVQSLQSYHNTLFRKEAVSISPIETWSRSYFSWVKHLLFIQRKWNSVCVQLVQRACKRGPFSPQPVIKRHMPARTRNLISSPACLQTTARPTDDPDHEISHRFWYVKLHFFCRYVRGLVLKCFHEKRAYMGLVMQKFVVRVMMVRLCC